MGTGLVWSDVGQMIETDLRNLEQHRNEHFAEIELFWEKDYIPIYVNGKVAE